MHMLRITKNAYRVVRSVIFSLLALPVFLYILLYVVLSMPLAQNYIRDYAVEELSAVLATQVSIGKVDISPFSEVNLHDVAIPDPSGSKCIEVETLGAGISLTDLIFRREITVTYAEILGLDGHVAQKSEGGPLNIQFLIDAFSPKEKNKPPTKFRLQIRNIVIRRSSLSYDREWIPRIADSKRMDFNHLQVDDLAADLRLPLLSDKGVDAELRRLKLTLKPGLTIERLSCDVKARPKMLSVRNLSLLMANSDISISDLDLKFKSFAQIAQVIDSAVPLSVSLSSHKITPSDFASLYPPLAQLDTPWLLDIQGSCSRKSFALERLSLQSYSDNLQIEVTDAAILRQAKTFDGEIGNIRLHAGAKALAQVSSLLREVMPGKNLGNVGRILQSLGDVELQGSGALSAGDRSGNLQLAFASAAGNLEAEGEFFGSGEGIALSATLDAENVDPQIFLPSLPVGLTTLTADVDLDFNPSAGGGVNDLSGLRRFWRSGEAAIRIAETTLRGESLKDVELTASKEADRLTAHISSPNQPVAADISLAALLAGQTPELELNADIADLPLRLLTSAGGWAQSELGGKIRLKGSADPSLSPDSLQAYLALDDIRISGAKDISLKNLRLTSSADGLTRLTTLRSDWVNGEIKSDMALQKIVPASKALLAEVFPQFIPVSAPSVAERDEAGLVDFNFSVNTSLPWSQFAKLPVKPLYDITLSGKADFARGMMSLRADAPYLQQGRDKLVKNTGLQALLADHKVNLKARSTIPTKKGILDLHIDAKGDGSHADLCLDFNPESHGGFYGTLLLCGDWQPAIDAAGAKAMLKIHPSTLWLNNAAWDVGECSIEYADKRVKVENFSVAHDAQHVTINGLMSQSPDDVMVVDLSDVNLNYIFDTLNIEYVMFGGNATGQAIAKGVFSSQPDIRTRGLKVDGLSYNGCVLGDADLQGDFDISRMRVGIGARVREEKRRVADIDGGIWIGRDSLSFNFDADKVRIGFLQKFMQAFSSHVDGRASGKGTLYGTFKDIDMKGRFFADTIAVKLDFTNVVYTGSDSVFIDPGRITVPPFTLHDRYGNTAIFSGHLTHHYFHAPSFTFNISNCRRLLVYDTNASLNPIWYGRIFGSGSGSVHGTPTSVDIIADITTDANSDFTFVLDDRLEATDYTFLTFTDRKRTMREMLLEEKEKASTDYIEETFRRKVQTAIENESADFSMDLRATVTPQATMNLIMDPEAGDKITAHGHGPINITYASRTDEMKMFGKYIIDEGKYNFTLQDLILKDFLIKEGSTVSFNGDPMNAMLDIRGAYRVMTNLTELDKSFAYDRDLNRTNVPVDAMLLVRGDMTHPDISFDIELPTLNDEVERKVRSIIASEDMMNRQIMYLLALNRFYTPEYNGGTGGGEWASVASSTLSSQLQNILGQLTDKVTVAPSLRSDKGDFSDLEFDVALATRLFNNRLLINGNLGYRDRSTSSTTFVGDFDIEYLLTRSGDLRLKAYNHFNDQNYYLKSALTTQGVGIIFRHNFGSLLAPSNTKRKQSVEDDDEGDARVGEDSSPKSGNP